MGSDVTIRYTLDGSEPDMNSMAYNGPFTLTSSRVVRAKSFGGENRESSSAVAYFRITESNAYNGIRYNYYEDKSWEFLPTFITQKIINAGTTFQFRIDDIPKRKEQFAIRFTSYLQIDSVGTYKFYALSDDGSKIYINGNLLVNNDGGHGPLERSGSLQLGYLIFYQD